MHGPTVSSQNLDPTEAVRATGYVWGIALVAALGGLLFGYDWVVIGGARQFFEIYFHLDSAQPWDGPIAAPSWDALRAPLLRASLETVTDANQFCLFPQYSLRFPPFSQGGRFPFRRSLFGGSSEAWPSA